jgi:hypothetical protein
VTNSKSHHLVFNFCYLAGRSRSGLISFIYSNLSKSSKLRKIYSDTLSSFSACLCALRRVIVGQILLIFIYSFFSFRHSQSRWRPRSRLNSVFDGFELEWSRQQILDSFARAWPGVHSKAKGRVRVCSLKSYAFLILDTSFWRRCLLPRLPTITW